MACKFHKHIRSNLFGLSITILIKLEKLSDKNVDECVGSKTHRGFFFSNRYLSAWEKQRNN